MSVLNNATGVRQPQFRISGHELSALVEVLSAARSSRVGFLFAERSASTDDSSSLLISNFCIVPDDRALWDGHGRLDEQAVLKLTNSPQVASGCCVGWLRSRRNSACRPSVRETAVHRQLLNVLKPRGAFAFGLFTLSHGCQNAASHDLRVQLNFSLFVTERLRPTSLQVVSLQATSASGSYVPESWLFTRSTSCSKVSKETLGYIAELEERVQKAIGELLDKGLHESVERDLRSVMQELVQQSAEEARLRQCVAFLKRGSTQPPVLRPQALTPQHSSFACPEGQLVSLTSPAEPTSSGQTIFADRHEDSESF